MTPKKKKKRRKPLKRLADRGRLLWLVGGLVLANLYLLVFGSFECLFGESARAKTFGGAMLETWDITRVAPAKRLVRERTGIVVYTASDCQPCEYLCSHMSALGVEFTRIDVASNPRARAHLIELYGKRVRLPVVEITGLTVYGYSPNRLESFLKQTGILK